jgi:MerR family transcriptional regulator, thiopeptide resistance regulator
MSYTVRQLAKLAGVSPRTLHYYDEIGLLRPEKVGENGYRYYGEPELLRLQQILFYKELDFSLEQITEILTRPDFDLRDALRQHKAGLEERARRLNRLIETVDHTIHYLQGETKMADKELFEGWSEEKQPEYEKEIRERCGDTHVTESVKNWNDYSKEEKARIQAEGEENYRALAACISAGPGSTAAQAAIARWHQNLRYFYEPSIEIMRGLGQMYVDDGRFRKNFTKLNPNLPEFTRDAINIYCDRLVGKK